MQGSFSIQPPDGFKTMHNSIKPVAIKNAKGKILFGIMHEPQKKQGDTGIIILSPGIKSRVGPHRLYVKMTTLFNRLGFPVLRADPEGLGDSEGEIDQQFTADVYCSIELGLLVPDTIAMMDFMQEKLGISKFILAGLCGGAITALLASENDNRVCGILCLGMTCVLASANIDLYKYITAQQLSSIRKKYIKKILNGKAWLRFITFQSDFKLLVKSLSQPFVKNVKREHANIDDKGSKIRNGTQIVESNLNPHFHRAFSRFVMKKKILLIFSGSDRLYWEFEEKYLNNYGNAIEPYRGNFEIFIVKDANHVFSLKEWQQHMVEKSETWLKEKYLD